MMRRSSEFLMQTVGICFINGSMSSIYMIRKFRKIQDLRMSILQNDPWKLKKCKKVKKSKKLCAFFTKCIILILKDYFNVKGDR